MYNASADFHRAVFEAGAEQRVLVKLTDNTIFTNEDIAISQGIKVSEAVNPDEELTIGSAPSAEFTATIINDKGLLNGYTYGEADVLLGVRTASYTSNFTCPTAILRYGGDSPIVFNGSSSLPYLTVNGYAPVVQPPFGVAAILICGAMVYCISANGALWMAAWVDGSTWNALAQTTWGDIETDIWGDIQGALVPISEADAWNDISFYTWENMTERTWQSFAPWFEINAFMTEKAKGWAAKGKGFWFNGNVLYDFGETVDKYEYVPLGKYVINTPTKRKIDLVAISAFDRMSKFDIDATEFWAGIEYPTTIGNIFAGLCEFVGVPRATLTFINSTRAFDEAPATYDAITAREILKWIAEAACSYARMTRDGEIELVWFGAEAVSIPMTQYFSIDVAEYSVPQIDKLQVMSAENDIGVIIGTGTNGYQTVDNPMLYGANDTEIRTYATPIYNRLAAFATFNPINANAVCDWSIQAGDIIEIVIDDVTYSLPVYSQTITWKGGAKVVYESTGMAARPVMDVVNRKELSSERKFFKIDATIDGLNLALTNNALTFDGDGLHIFNGCFEIFNADDVKVFGVDVGGNIDAVGTFTSTGEQYGHILKMSLEAGKLSFFVNDEYSGSFGANTTGHSYLDIDTINVSGSLWVRFPDNIFRIAPRIIQGAAVARTTSSFISFGSPSPFGTSIPTVLTQYETTQVGDLGALKVSNVTSAGFDIQIGGSGTSDVNFDWVAII